MTYRSYARRRIDGSDVLAELIVSVLMTLFGGWMFMLAVGVVHHEWIRQCPTIGYAWALLLAALFRGALFLGGNWRKGQQS